MLAGSDQPGGMGVSQVMDPARLADSLRDCRAPDPAERSPPQVGASFGGPHQPVDQRVLVDVLSDRVQGDSGEGDGALRCRRLWPTQTWSFSSCFDERRSNGEPAAQHVDGSDPETGELSPAKTGVGGHDRQRLIAVWECSGEQIDFLGIEETHVRSSGVG
ncbi:MAG TPA: hypothetical protein VJ948_05020 [Acidimicrobiia bacterium]|nr:hypothetical protein [Acidimicrobiia bacterium]